MENLREVIKVVSGIVMDYEIILIDDGNEEFPHIGQSEYVKVITNRIIIN